MDRRLQRRYLQLVREHLHASQSVAAGLSALPGVGLAFASTQAAWRFFANEAVSLPKLVQPLRKAGREAAAHSDSDFVLLVHDWSKLNYGHHTSKSDRVQLSNSQDIGYELLTSLLVDAADGSPLAPMELEVTAADGVHTTRSETVTAACHHLEQVLPTMQAARGWKLPRSVVHVIDREADSLAHFREWASDGHWFLVRADNERRVNFRGASRLLPEIVTCLEDEGAFVETQEIRFHDRPARQFVAEAAVLLDRPGRKRTTEGRRQMSGPPLPLRLIVAQARDDDDRVLAQWLLLTNVPDTVPAERIALWYYWRWLIETYFKLLKNAGQQLDHWQQESVEAIAKRLLVASMACVTVWRLQRSTSPGAEEVQRVLVRLSGRQMKRRRPVTAPALLAGLEKLIAVLDLLDHYDLDYIRHLLTQTIPVFADTS